MKVLIVANGMDIGGAETHIATLCHELVSRSHSVTVLAPYGVYTRQLQKSGVRCIALPAYQKNASSFVRGCRAVRRACQEMKPDVVHSHARPIALECALVCRELGLPHVTTAHLPFDRRHLREYMTVWGDATLSVSRDITRHLGRVYGVERCRIFETVNGIDTEKFRASGTYASSLVHVSRLDRDRAKTAELLLSCANAVFRDGRCERIVIIGDGSEYARLKKRADAINRKLEKKFVHMAGKQSDIAPFLKNRPVFIGVSRAALEAMACECTVILSGNEGYIGLLEEGMLPLQYGENFCARSGKRANASDMLKDIRRALSLPCDVRRTRGRRMRAFVQRYYETERMAKDAERAYRFALEQRVRRHTTILCGYFGYGNAGDELVLRSMIEKYGMNGEKRIAVIGGQKSRLKAANLSVKRIGKYDIPAFLFNVRRYDRFVLAGGNLLQNQTGNLSLAYYLIMAYLAKSKGAHVQILRGGIGDLRGKMAKKAGAAVLRLSSAISLRTPEDIECAKRLIGEKCRITYECDASLLSPFCRFEKGEIKSSGRYTVALREPRTHEEKRQTASLLRAVTANSGKAPRFLPFHQKEDLSYAKKLLKAVGVGSIVEWRKIEDIARFMRETDFCITSRLHAVYAAVLCGIPCYALDYDRKMRAHVQYMVQCARAVNCPLPVALIRADSSCLPPLEKLGKGDCARLCAAMVTGGAL